MFGIHYLSTCLVLAMVTRSTYTQTEHRRKNENDFSKDFLYSTRYDFLPPTATVPIYICDYSHRPLDGNVNQFQVYHIDRWWTQSCPENLEWNQGSCRCEYPDGNPANTHCRDYRHNTRGVPGKYEQYVNGDWIVRDCSLAVAGLVWDQSACQCVWGPGTSRKVTGQGITPCDMMLNMTFDAGVKDEAKGSFVEVARGDSLHTQPLGRDNNNNDNNNMAAHFQGTALNIWFFSNNELGSSLRVEFQFKMDNIPESREKYQILLSNGCNVTVPGYTTPSLAIGYRPGDESYLLAFQTVSNRKAIACSLKLGAYDWHAVSLIYEDGVLFLRIDGHPCIVSQDFVGDIQTTACPLTIGADPLERQSQYHGYMDNVLVGRYCRRYMDIQDDSEEDSKTSSSDVNRSRRLRRNQNVDAWNAHFTRTSTGDKPGIASNKQPVISSFRARIGTKKTHIFDPQIEVKPIQSNTRHTFQHSGDRTKIIRSLNNRLRNAQNIRIVNELDFDGYGEEADNSKKNVPKGDENMIRQNELFEKRFFVDDEVNNNDYDDSVDDENRIGAAVKDDDGNNYNTHNEGLPVERGVSGDDESFGMANTREHKRNDYSANYMDGYGDNGRGGHSGVVVSGGGEGGKNNDVSKHQIGYLGGGDNDVLGRTGNRDGGWIRKDENGNGLRMSNDVVGKIVTEKIDGGDKKYNVEEDVDDINDDIIDDNESNDNIGNNNNDVHVDDDEDNDDNDDTYYGESKGDDRDDDIEENDKKSMQGNSNNKNVDDIGLKQRIITKWIAHGGIRRNDRSKIYHQNTRPVERKTTKKVRKILWWMRHGG